MSNQSSEPLPEIKQEEWESYCPCGSLITTACSQGELLKKTRDYYNEMGKKPQTITVKKKGQTENPIVEI